MKSTVIYIDSTVIKSTVIYIDSTVTEEAKITVKSVFAKRKTQSAKSSCTLGGIRTHNPRFRRPMPYPLGHEGRL